MRKFFSYRKYFYDFAILLFAQIDSSLSARNIEWNSEENDLIKLARYSKYTY